MPTNTAVLFVRPLFWERICILTNARQVASGRVSTSFWLQTRLTGPCSSHSWHSASQRQNSGLQRRPEHGGVSGPLETTNAVCMLLLFGWFLSSCGFVSMFLYSFHVLKPNNSSNSSGFAKLNNRIRPRQRASMLPRDQDRWEWFSPILGGLRRTNNSKWSGLFHVAHGSPQFPTSKAGNQSIHSISQI